MCELKEEITQKPGAWKWRFPLQYNLKSRFCMSKYMNNTDQFKLTNKK